MDQTLSDRARKGRGAVSNRGSRYDAETTVAFDDGWGSSDLTGDDLPPLRTTVSPDATRTIIARNDSPDIGFDRSINPYRGCEHGCIYCFARPTHAYLGLSPGLDFETKLTAKFDAPALLERELRAKTYQCAVMAMGTNTDPYQPIEREHRITRGILQVLAEHKHPVGIVTKSALVARDIDILGPMAAEGLCTVLLSVTTLDADLARTMEPRASTPQKRLAAIAALARAGIPTGVMAAPMIPALNDNELEAILAAARDAGAQRANMTLLRLPLEIKDLFTEWLESHAPGKAQHVLSLIRQSRGGKLNDPNFHSRFAGSGAYAQMLEQRFRRACQKLGLNKTPLRLDTTKFRLPPRPGDQLALL